jgi:uncharacterized membrane protein YjgN (DUF898 family)
MNQQSYKTSFIGEGVDLFKIQLVNFLLGLVTLGFYYPWAKAKKLQFLYSSTTLEGHPFAFTGTGKEMFKGFIRAVLLFVGFYSILFVFIYFKHLYIGAAIFYLGILAIIPLAIHGSFRYRMAKTVWKGIRFGYLGERGKLIKLFAGGLLLSIITFGLYFPFFSIKLRTYIIQNIKVGDATFDYNGDDTYYFWLSIGGYILSVLTLGIYSFWWQKKLFEFFVNHIQLRKHDKELRFRSRASVGDFFELIIINFLITVFTLGLGYPWTLVRTLKFVTRNIIIEGHLSLDELQQLQSDYSNATGEDLSDMLDLGLVI